MRRVVVGGLLLLLCLVNSAFATDYELTVDSSSKQLLQSRTVTVYEPFGLIKPGDHIISIAAGPLPKPSMTCKVILGTGEGSTVLTPRGTIKKFAGEIRLGKGNPSSALDGALLMHVPVQATDDVNTNFVKETGSFLSGHPLVWIGIGFIGLLLVLVAILRMNSTPDGSPPVYGKKAYEENIRDVKAKLERVLESQEMLVRKPPVLRSFRKQIDRFDKRLDKLEVTSVSTQQALSVIASSVVDLQKSLEMMVAHQEEAKVSVGELKAKVAEQSDESKRSSYAIGEELKSQSHRVNEVNRAFTEKLAAHGEKIDGASKELQSQLAGVQERVSTSEAAVKQLQTALQSTDQANAKRADDFAGQVKHILGQIEGLSPLSANVSELHGRVANLKNELAGLSEKINVSTAQLGEFQRANVLAHAATDEKINELAGLSEKIDASTAEVGEFQRSNVLAHAAIEDKIAEFKAALTELGTELRRIYPELEVARSVSEANAATVSELTEQLQNLQDQTATREQLERLLPLQMLPDAIAVLKKNVEGVDERLSKTGLNKEDQRKILEAHEKLGSLPGEVSQTLQRVLEQKLASLLAQAVTPKKGKDSEGSGISDRGATALSEVAKHLIAEIEQQKNLEHVLAEVKTKLDALPDSFSKLESKIAVPVQMEVSQVPVEEIRELLFKTQQSLESVPARFDSIEQGLDEAALRWNQTSLKLEQTIHLVNELKASVEKEALREPVVHYVQVPAAPAEAKSLASAEVEKPPLTVEAKEKLVAPKEELHVESPSPVTEVHEEAPLTVIEAHEESSSPGIEVHEEAPLPINEDRQEELSVSEPEEPLVAEVVAKKSVAPAGAPSKAKVYDLLSEEWLSGGGNLQGTWSTGCNNEVALVKDAEKAMRPLTPTETPGIEYQIGPMLFAQKKIIYAHGDSIRAFWPGQNERSILLSHMIPGDHWRLLLLGQRLFCVQEKRVEIIDLGTWTRSSYFAGEYLQQCGMGNLWAGIRGVSQPVLVFRDYYGEEVGTPVDLSKEFKECLPMVSDGKSLYISNRSGEILRGNKEGFARFANVGEGKNSTLSHVALTSAGVLSVTSSQDGIVLKLLAEDGTVSRELEHKSHDISGNIAVLGDRLHFFDSASSELCTCDLGTLEVVKRNTLPNVQRVRRLVGFVASNLQTMLIAGSDTGGKLGTVFLFDPETAQHVFLCSTNQPHVDAIFAGGCPVVATSSSYQNIIRVFQPFATSEASGQAA